MGRASFSIFILIAEFALVVLAASPRGARAEVFPSDVALGLELMVRQGTCEATWQTLARDLGVEHHSLSVKTTLWLVPCADWAQNVAWAVFVLIDEPSHAEGAIAKPQFFVNYSRQTGIKADNVIYNVRWSPQDKSLIAVDNFSSASDCGTRALYRWNPDQQSFVLQVLQKKDLCKPEGTWETLLGAAPNPDAS